MPVRRILLTPLLLAAGLAEAGTVDTPQCRRDLLVMESELSQAKARLLQAGEQSRKAQCDTWRQHVAIVKRANALFGRCKTDTERRVMMGDMQTQAQDFEEAIASQCR